MGSQERLGFVGLQKLILWGAEGRKSLLVMQCRQHACIVEFNTHQQQHCRIPALSKKQTLPFVGCVIMLTLSRQCRVMTASGQVTFN